jgi:hypothetical protein
MKSISHYSDRKAKLFSAILIAQSAKWKKGVPEWLFLAEKCQKETHSVIAALVEVHERSKFIISF